MLLNYAGVALYELWSLDGARALFQAALRLDPSLPHVRRNLEEIGRRRAQPSAASAERAGVRRAALPALAQRAKRVAARAQPATGLKLSLCMIVRDEEEMLPRCLAAVAPAVDEIIVVDTGSRDRTIEIAESFGARVIEREWTGSFSDARNVSFDAATGDWIIYLDADEVLVSEDVERLRALTGRTWREAFYLVRDELHRRGGRRQRRHLQRAEDVPQPSGVPLRGSAARADRTAPSRRTYRSGSSRRRCGSSTTATSARVRDAKEKSRRNIELLRAQQAESPPTPFLHFNLGSEYAAAGDAPAALAEFERAWAMVKDETRSVSVHVFAPTLVVRLVKALRACGRPAGRDRPCARPDLERFPASPTSCSSRLRRRSRSAASTTRSRYYRALHRDGRRLGPLHRDRRLRHLPPARRTGRAASCRCGELDAGARAAGLVPEGAAGLLRHGAPLRTSAAAQRDRRRRRRRRDGAAGRRADSDGPVHAGDRAV